MTASSFLAPGLQEEKAIDQMITGACVRAHASARARMLVCKSSCVKCCEAESSDDVAVLGAQTTMGSGDALES